MLKDVYQLLIETRTSFSYTYTLLILLTSTFYTNLSHKFVWCFLRFLIILSVPGNIHSGVLDIFFQEFDYKEQIDLLVKVMIFPRSAMRCDRINEKRVTWSEITVSTLLI